MKKFLLIIVITLLCVLSSCSKGNIGAGNKDSVPYEEYKTIELEGTVYKVFMPSNVNMAIQYTYYDLDVTSNKEEWLVNSLVDLSYTTTNDYKASPSLLSKVYDVVSKDPILDGLTFTANVKESNVYEIEGILSNASKEEISARVFIAYLCIKVKTDDSRFSLAIPVYEKILKVTNDYVTDPFTNEDILKTSFQNTYKN